MPERKLTVEKFVDIAWRQMVVRGLVEDETPSVMFPHGSRKTTIKLYAASQDTDHNRNLVEVIYVGRADSLTGFDAFRPTGIQKRFLGDGLGEKTWTPHIQELLEGEWPRETPCFLSSKPIAIYRKTGDAFKKMWPASLRLMLNYTRLRDALEYEVEKRDDYSYWISFHMARMNGLIKEQGYHWDQILN